MPDEAQQHWQYWDVLGDWAMKQQRYPEAVRAYFEASRCDLRIDSVAIKLARALRLCGEGWEVDETAAFVAERGELLNQFLQQKERFYKMGMRSNAVVTEMAESLEKLGRLWEAEAWAASGLSEPDRDAEKLRALRDGIVGKLTKDTPWQARQNHPYVTMDLRRFPMTDVGETSQPDRELGPMRIQPSSIPKLVNEAKLMGLGRRSQRSCSRWR